MNKEAPSLGKNSARVQQVQHGDLGCFAQAIWMIGRQCQSIFLAVKAHSSAEGAGAGIICLLELCELDFSKDLAKINTSEQTAQAAYYREIKQNEIEKPYSGTTRATRLSCAYEGGADSPSPTARYPLRHFPPRQLQMPKVALHSASKFLLL